ncbi:DUF4386 family protein [Actinomadura montaniterrae]|uniref:DUF4386 family protein n=1 Tax=Actinomadura montaniterrae TaxID=1803903 RepID=A0A6L3VU92_9ACTN|nr:DUF4386 family protein [Actinomadura montaniterrae]KAB2381614.1 DUF4386 family protein [Actinomadura montaniterrae]
MSTTVTEAGGRTSAARRDHRRYWRLLLAAAAPVAGLTLAVTSALTPYGLGDDDDSAAVAAIAAHRGAVEANMWLGVLFVTTLVPGAIAVLWVCRRRNPTLTAVAGTVVLLGFLSSAGNTNTDLLVLAGLDKGVAPGTLATLSGAMNGMAVVSVALLPMLIAITLGRILLGVLLWRARVAPRWMAAALVAAPFVEFVNVTGGNAQPAIGWALTGVGFASATVALLRMRDDEFDLPPLPA